MLLAKFEVSIDDLIKNFSIHLGNEIFSFTRLGVPTPNASKTDKLKISDFDVKTLHHDSEIILNFSSY